MLMGQIQDAGGQPVLVLALLDKDIEAIRAGDPVYCHTADLPGLPDVDIAVTYGGADREQATMAIAQVLPAGARVVRKPMTTEHDGG